MSDLVEVYRAADVPQAHTVCNFLQEAGIPAVVQGDALQSVLGALPLGWSSQPRVMVHAENAAWARSLLDAVEAAADDERLPETEEPAD
jgi:hypothetical protein